MKKIPILLTVFLLLLLTGCKTNNPITDNQIGENMNIDIFEKVKSIKITDPCCNMYQDELNLMLNETESDNLCRILEEETVEKTASKNHYLYAAEFLDANGELLARGLADVFHSIEIEGLGLYKNAELEKYLTDLESSYHLDQSLWNRIPGKQYLGLLDKAKRGSFTEITENNFVEGKEEEISKDDINELIGISEDLSFTKATEPAKKKALIDLYSENGACIYSFFQDESGNIFTDAGYMISDKKIRNWFQQFWNR